MLEFVSAKRREVSDCCLRIIEKLFSSLHCQVLPVGSLQFTVENTTEYFWAPNSVEKASLYPLSLLKHRAVSIAPDVAQTMICKGEKLGVL